MSRGAAVIVAMLAASSALAGPAEEDAALIAALERAGCKVTPDTALALIRDSRLAETAAMQAMERLRAAGKVRDTEEQGMPTITLVVGGCR